MFRKLASLLVVVTICQVEACPRILRPVCGSNGVTYDNLCLLEQAQALNASVTFVSEGECPTSTLFCGMRCSKEYIPVCGSNGVTYANKCLFHTAQCSDPELANMTIVAEKACEEA